MIVNGSDPEVQGKRKELAATALYAAVFEAAHASPYPLRLCPDASGLELGGTEPVAGRPNRALMKLFPIGPRRFAAFFYKRSQVPFSRDRFAYGAVILEEGRLDAAEVQTWCRWLHEGFPPEMPPARIKRAFAFTVPDD